MTESSEVEERKSTSRPVPASHPLRHRNKMLSTKIEKEGPESAKEFFGRSDDL